MAESFKWCFFKDIELNDSFFNSLKKDYHEFSEWYQKKSNQDSRALVFKDENGIGAFLYLKEEEEEIELENSVLPSKQRLKIGTLMIAERCRRMRLGEGAIGVALWNWQSLKFEEVYVTVFEKHNLLIKLFEEFGFTYVGNNNRGERVYIKNKNHIDFSNPCTVFPFISGRFDYAGIIPIDEKYHDSLFPYSELKNLKEIEEATAKNGIKKVFIATPCSDVVYRKNMPVFIYRKFLGKGQKTYKSTITSFCTITDIVNIKLNKKNILSVEEFIKYSSNKTVYNEEELRNIYSSSRNVLLIEMIYNGYFGKGNNVNHRKLDDSKLFQDHPYKIRYTKEEFKEILRMGKADEHNIVINQS